MEVKIEVIFQKEDIFQVKTKDLGTAVYVDKSKEDSKPLGPNPLELFLAALASCIGVYAKKYLLTHTIEFKKLAIDIRADFSQEYPSRLVNIKAQVHTDANLGQNQEVFLRFIRNCPIHNTILNTKEIGIEIA